MRVTGGMLVDTVVRNLAANLGRLEALEDQLTSGKRLARPSDDPAAVGQALTLRAAVSAGEQYLRSLDGAEAWLQATDAALGSATEVLQRARALAVQGGSEALSGEQLGALATEVDQLLQRMLNGANSSLRGQRLFAGRLTDANPFSLSAGPPQTAVYAGDDGQLLREVDAGVTLAINVPGSTALPAAFSALIDLRDRLRAGDSTGVRTGSLPALDTAMNGLLAVRAEVGAKSNRVEALRDRQQEMQVRLKGLLSKNEDVDFAEAITRFATEENVYKAALAAGARAMQPSLLDYLR